MDKNHKHIETISVDVAFCIDATSCMQTFIEAFQIFARTFYNDLQNSLKKSFSENIVLNLRARAVAFKDLTIGEPLQATPFYNLSEDIDKFCDFFYGKKAYGGGPEPDSAIEALIEAIRSDWILGNSSKRRHFIVLFSDSSAHIENITTFYDEWGGMDVKYKRLVLFTPEIEPWLTIEDAIENTLLYPVRRGYCLQDFEFEDLVKIISDCI